MSRAKKQHNMKKRLYVGLLSALIGSVAFGQSIQHDTIDVVTSIKPIALIANDLLAGQAKLTILVPAGSSPHDYSLKVSDMMALSEADMIIWLGPELEHFLEKVIKRNSDKRVLTLSKSLEIVESGGKVSGHEQDLHYWLDPAGAKKIATLIARQIVEQSPQRAEEIEERLKLVLKDYTLLKSAIDQKLKPHQNTPFMVYHNGYDYLVDAFGLKQIAWITQSPEQSVGVKRLYELQKQLERYEGSKVDQERPHCLFVESTHQSSSVKNIASRLQLEPYPLDLLAAEETIASYRQLMSAIANTMAECLSGN